MRICEPVEIFVLDDYPEISSDEIDRVVTFKGGSDLSHPARKPLRLRLVLKDADLYSDPFQP